jgi:hypothetical protein
MEKLKYEMVALEPMLSSRYQVKFLDGFLDFNPENISKIDLPKFSNGEWQDINIEFMNTADSNTFVQLSKIISRHKINLEIQINILGPAADVLGTWNVNVKIKNVDFGILDYADVTTDSILKSKASFAVVSAQYSYNRNK